MHLLHLPLETSQAVVLMVGQEMFSSFATASLLKEKILLFLSRHVNKRGCDFPVHIFKKRIHFWEWLNSDLFWDVLVKRIYRIYPSTKNFHEELLLIRTEMDTPICSLDEEASEEICIVDNYAARWTLVSWRICSRLWRHNFNTNRIWVILHNSLTVWIWSCQISIEFIWTLLEMLFDINIFISFILLTLFFCDNFFPG